LAVIVTPSAPKSRTGSHADKSGLNRSEWTAVLMARELIR
jgi:hypothetical protein